MFRFVLGVEVPFNRRDHRLLLGPNRTRNGTQPWPSRVWRGLPSFVETCRNASALAELPFRARFRHDGKNLLYPADEVRSTLASLRSGGWT
jgi:hypothetical protein